jgi:hypothetical protein
MSNKKLSRWLIAATALIACVIGILGVVWHVEGPPTLSLGQPFIQAKLDNKIGAAGYQIPQELLLKKHANWLGVKDVTIQNVRLDLSGDRIGLTVIAQVLELHTPYTITASTSGDLRYESGAFYFEPHELQLVSIVSPNGNAGENIGKAVDKLGQSRLLNKLGLADDLLAHKAPLTAFGERVVQERVQKVAVAALRSHPVYTFKDDWKGFVARASLQSVEVKDFHIIAHVSFLQLTTTVLLYGMMAIACAAIALAIVASGASGAGGFFFFF